MAKRVTVGGMLDRLRNAKRVVETMDTDLESMIDELEALGSMRALRKKIGEGDFSLSDDLSSASCEIGFAARDVDAVCDQINEIEES